MAGAAAVAQTGAFAQPAAPSADEAPPAADASPTSEPTPPAEAPPAEKRVIGATATLREASTGAALAARIDTGAKTCAMHSEEIRIEGESEKMKKNIGKPARLRIVDRDGESHWIETKIADTVLIKNPNSDKPQRRYKVWLSLRHGEVQKRVLVSLSDRSHLEFPLLIGRNFLRGDFVVDVAVNGDR